MQIASMAGMVSGESEERKALNVERSWSRVGGIVGAADGNWEA